MLVLNFIVLTHNYQLVLLSAIYEPNYIGSFDPLEPNELD